jgi:hypothetical protein
MTEDPGNPRDRARPTRHDDCWERVGENHRQTDCSQHCGKNSHELSDFEINL